MTSGALIQRTGGRPLMGSYSLEEALYDGGERDLFLSCPPLKLDLELDFDRLPDPLVDRPRDRLPPLRDAVRDRADLPPILLPDMRAGVTRPIALSDNLKRHTTTTLMEQQW
jgi:hypothetical protein